MQTPNWLEPRPIPRKLRDCSPRDEFERGLNEWLEHRSDELDRAYIPDYGYYGADFRGKQRGLSAIFDSSEDTRAGIRNGALDADNWWVDAQNIPAYTVLQWTASRLGWRIVPLGRYGARKLNNQAISHDVEAACREWVEWANAVWYGLVRLPDNRRNRDSQRAQIEPLLARACEINTLLVDRLERSGLQMYGGLM